MSSLPPLPPRPNKPAMPGSSAPKLPGTPLPPQSPLSQPAPAQNPVTPQPPAVNPPQGFPQQAPAPQASNPYMGDQVAPQQQSPFAQQPPVNQQPDFNQMPAPQGVPTPPISETGGDNVGIMSPAEGSLPIPPTPTNIVLNDGYLGRFWKRMWLTAAVVFGISIVLSLFREGGISENLGLPIIVGGSLILSFIIVVILAKTVFRPAPIDFEKQTITIKGNEIPFHQVNWAEAEMQAGNALLFRFGTGKDNKVTLTLFSPQYNARMSEVVALGTMLPYTSIPVGTPSAKGRKILVGKIDINTMLTGVYGKHCVMKEKNPNHD